MNMNSIAAATRSVAYCARRPGIVIVLGFVSATAWAGTITLSPVQCTLQFNAGSPTGCDNAIIPSIVKPEAGVTETLRGMVTKNLLFIHADVESQTLPITVAEVRITASVLYEALVSVKLGAPKNIGLELIHQVPVIINTAGSATCTGNGAIFSHSSDSSAVKIGANIVGSASCGENKPEGTVFSQPTKGAFPQDIKQVVNMQLEGTLMIESGDGIAGAASFDARADPTFEIDPTFAFASDFEVITSPDAASAVPEPGLMGPLGLGCIVLLLRKRYRPV